MQSHATGPRSAINVTPLVDIVLVLLIVFMIAVPVAQLGQPVRTPPSAAATRPVVGAPLLVRVGESGAIFLNRERLGEDELAVRLRQALAGRSDRVVFFAASGELDYERVAEVLDLCRTSGATVGIVFSDFGV